MFCVVKNKYNVTKFNNEQSILDFDVFSVFRSISCYNNKVVQQIINITQKKQQQLIMYNILYRYIISYIVE